jgi:GNAT superfamily N-acetyltransferase
MIDSKPDTVAIRLANPADTAAIIDVLADAFADGPVARWLHPDLATRAARSPDYFEIFVSHALTHGEIHTTDDLTAVALWLRYTQLLPPPDDYDRRLADACGSAITRAYLLDATLTTRHPTDPHHHLAFIGVRPDLHNRGLGSALLNHHHTQLDRLGLPAYLVANDPRNRDLYLRHGYRLRDAAMRLPDGPPLWPMWRRPHPDRPPLPA